MLIEALIIAASVLVHAWVTYHVKKTFKPGDVHVHPNIHHENKPDRSASRFVI